MGAPQSMLQTPHKEDTWKYPQATPRHYDHHKMNTEYLTFGYVRQFEMNNSSYITPIEIFQIIPRCYGVIDNFDWNNPKSIGKYHTMITKHIIQHNGCFGWNTSLFREIITSGKHRWSFRIRSQGKRGIDIGIWRVTCNQLTWNKSFVEDGTGYCYNVGYGQKYDGNIFEN